MTTLNDRIAGKMNPEGFRELFPVGRSTHSIHVGKFGWRRVNGCLNLNACRFHTEAEAEADRDANFEAWLKNPSDFSL